MGRSLLMVRLGLFPLHAGAHESSTPPRTRAPWPHLLVMNDLGGTALDAERSQLQVKR